MAAAERRVPIPATRDPFINTPLLRLTDSDAGEPRYWISSWNSVSGATGVLVTESGRERVYRFGPPHGGFYSAMQEDDDTLWLCGDLSRVVRLTLSTGDFSVYETGAPSALMFEGMVIDRAAGKLFGAAYPPPSMVGFSFDYRNRRPIRVYEDFTTDHYSVTNFPNGDGTHSLVVYNPDITLIRWDPATDSITPLPLSSISDNPPALVGDRIGIDRLLSDDNGRWLFPERGWYDPATTSFDPAGQPPDPRLSWFGRIGDIAWGGRNEDGRLAVGRWKVGSDTLTELFTVDDCTTFNAALSPSGAIVTISLYGEFARHNGHSGALELTRRLPTDAVAHIDCIRRIDADRLVGTPFITQRFWELDLTTGAGRDCGRAAGGSGEVLRTWNVGGKIYFASYTEGLLTEYDPHADPRFPENPRLVAAPPGGMRPVGHADDGRRIFYSASHHYGHLGCVLTAYDTETGEAVYADNPLPGLTVRGMAYDHDAGCLIAGSAIEADCESAPPSAEAAMVARIEPGALAVLETQRVPGVATVEIAGPLGDGRYLAIASGLSSQPGRRRSFAVSAAALAPIGPADLRPLPDGVTAVVGAGEPGFFVLQAGDRFELWDMRAHQPIRVLCEDQGAYRCFAEGGSAYFVTASELIVVDQILPD
jgi:hypothetical protein